MMDELELSFLVCILRRGSYFRWNTKQCDELRKEVIGAYTFYIDLKDNLENYLLKYNGEKKE